MPVVRDASAPSPNASTTVTTRANTTPSHGFHPSLSPFVPPSPTALPTMNPPTPTKSSCASDTIPPYDERNTIVAAASPSITVRVITNDTKKSEPTSGMTSSASTARGDREVARRSHELAHAGFPNSP